MSNRAGLQPAFLLFRLHFSVASRAVMCGLFWIDTSQLQADVSQSDRKLGQIVGQNRGRIPRSGTGLDQRLSSLF
jgi:hypothetical protein